MLQTLDPEVREFLTDEMVDKRYSFRGLHKLIFLTADHSEIVILVVYSSPFMTSDIRYN